MGRVEINPGLDEEVARRFMQPRVNRALDMLRDSAKMHAPETRVWVTARDDRVRPTHVDADTQTIPANLRFIIEKPGMGGDYEMARHPRDPGLSAGNAINCRCEDPTVPHLLRESIDRTLALVNGTRVEGTVYTRFPRAAESEFGTSEDQPSRFMGQALQEVARRLQAGHSR